MQLFKYLPEKYLDAFFRTGLIKLGNPYEYRKVKEYGAVIGDKEAGLDKTELSLPGGRCDRLGILHVRSRASALRSDSWFALGVNSYYLGELNVRTKA